MRSNYFLFLRILAIRVGFETNSIPAEAANKTPLTSWWDRARRLLV
jgi:hypothetical protein